MVYGMGILTVTIAYFVIMGFSALFKFLTERDDLVSRIAFWVVGLSVLGLMVFASIGTCVNLIGDVLNLRHNQATLWDYGEPLRAHFFEVLTCATLIYIGSVFVQFKTAKAKLRIQGFAYDQMMKNATKRPPERSEQPKLRKKPVKNQVQTASQARITMENDRSNLDSAQQAQLTGIIVESIVEALFPHISKDTHPKKPKE